CPVRSWRGVCLPSLTTSTSSSSGVSIVLAPGFVYLRLMSGSGSIACRLVALVYRSSILLGLRFPLSEALSSILSELDIDISQLVSTVFARLTMAPDNQTVADVERAPDPDPSTHQDDIVIEKVGSNDEGDAQDPNQPLEQATRGGRGITLRVSKANAVVRSGAKKKKKTTLVEEPSPPKRTLSTHADRSEAYVQIDPARCARYAAEMPGFPDDLFLDARSARGVKIPNEFDLPNQ
ncbi:Unknown protein, partial [Striga hermonthica]